MERSILHCDMNNFYASVECVLDPSIKDMPVAVCGNVEERHGIVLARNYKAKDKGVVAGEPVWQAQKKCPGIVIVNKPRFEKYSEYSEKAHEIYKRYTDYIEPMGLDECWLDVTESMRLFGKPKEIADQIRKTIKKELGLTISVGVSFNKTFAKLGSDLKKPDATTVISKDNFKKLVWPLPVSSIIGVGRRTEKVLTKNFIHTIGELANEKIERLEYLLGKNGIYLYNAANGLEDDPVSKYDELEEVKSIGHGITTIKDLKTDEEVWKTMLMLTQEIAWKLRNKNLRAGGVAVSIRDDTLAWHQFRHKLKTTEQSAINIARHAYELFKERYDWKRPIRNVTISTMYLVSIDEPIELNILDDYMKNEKVEKAEELIEKLNEKYGHEVVTTARLLDESNFPKERRRIKYDEKKY